MLYSYWSSIKHSSIVGLWVIWVLIHTYHSLGVKQKVTDWWQHREYIDDETQLFFQIHHLNSYGNIWHIKIYDKSQELYSKQFIFEFPWMLRILRK